MKDEHVEEELLQRYFDGELPAREAGEVAAHLQRCAACKARERSLSELHRMIGLATEDSGQGVDFDALFGRIEQGVRQQPTAGVVERLSFAYERTGGRPQRVFMPLAAAGLAAAAALLLILRPAASPTAPPTGTGASAGPTAAPPTQAPTGSSELDEVDFGAKTGTVWDVPVADGVSSLVVWIDDDDDEKGTE